MRVAHFVVVVTALLVAAGCIRTNTAMLDERTMIVSGNAGAIYSMAEVRQRVLLEAAREGRARGFQYFAVLGAENTSTSATIVMPGQTHTSGTVNASAYGVGNTAYGTATYNQTSFTTPGSAFEVMKPGQDLTIRFFRASEVNPGASGLWRVESILRAQSPDDLNVPPSQQPRASQCNTFECAQQRRHQ